LDEKAVVKCLSRPIPPKQRASHSTCCPVATDHIVSFKPFLLFLFTNLDISPRFAFILPDTRDAMLEFDINQAFAPFLNVTGTMAISSFRYERKSPRTGT
jgi:hypothetical protein